MSDYYTNLTTDEIEITNEHRIKLLEFYKTDEDPECVLWNLYLRDNTDGFLLRFEKDSTELIDEPDTKTAKAFFELIGEILLETKQEMAVNVSETIGGAFYTIKVSEVLSKKRLSLIPAVATKTLLVW